MSLNDHARILVVDDDPSMRLLLRQTLEQDGHVVEEAEDGETGLAMFERWAPDVVLLDANMPGMDGFTVCAQLQKRLTAVSVPIVMVTALQDESSITRAFEAGATDYVTKPINTVLLRHRLQRTIAAYRHQARVDYLAHHDAVTGLPNRVLLFDRFQHVLARAQRTREFVGVLYLDVDRFKPVNDTLGHSAGDQLLREIGDRIAHVARSCDTVARLGGDEAAAALEPPFELELPVDRGDEARHTGVMSQTTSQSGKAEGETSENANKIGSPSWTHFELSASPRPPKSSVCLRS